MAASMRKESDTVRKGIKQFMEPLCGGERNELVVQAMNLIRSAADKIPTST